MVLLFVLPCIAETKGTHPHTQAMVEMGSDEFFAQIALELDPPSSSSLLESVGLSHTAWPILYSQILLHLVFCWK
jgi:hypothetical protein